MNKELKKKLDEKAKEIWIGVAPSAKYCRTCAFALEDTEFVSGAEKPSCDMFDEKPDEVLWKDAECVFYEEVE